MKQVFILGVSIALLIGFIIFREIYLTTQFLAKYTYGPQNIDSFEQQMNQSSLPINNLPMSNKRENPKRVFCIVLTTPNNLATKALMTLYVWARLCTGYRFVSVKPDYLTGPGSDTVIKQSSFNLLQPKNLVYENYYELTNKVFSAFSEIYKEVGDRYDWYLKTDDDTYVNFDKLVKWINESGKDPEVPAIYGHSAFMIENIRGVSHNTTYNVGGPGYLMSKAAFQMLGEQLGQNMSFCADSGIEDLDVAKCLNKLGGRSVSATDEYNRVMFNPFEFGHIETYMNGKLCCSNYSYISAHYMQPEHMLRLDLVIKLMEEEYKRGEIPRPSYTDIYTRLVYMSKFLNSPTI